MDEKTVLILKVKFLEALIESKAYFDSTELDLYRKIFSDEEI